MKTKIGIIGGGQLGKMMILEAKKMGFYVVTLDPALDCPAHSISDNHIVAEFTDREALFSLAKQVDVITYELEHIDADTLMELENNNVKIFPTPKSLSLIQNKFVQKTILRENNIPIADFLEVKSRSDILEASKKFGFPLILKTCKGGYDGKGNAFIKNEEDIEIAFKCLGSGDMLLMVEEVVDFTMEISILACTSQDNSVSIFPVAKNIHRDSILDETHVPANINLDTTELAKSIASKVMQIFKGVGMFCIEMFVTKDNKILVNEVAPRPHNSGHYTIEGCITNQFEQHIRAITGLPLGDSSLISPTVMINILGEEDCVGEACITGLYEALQYKNAKVHIYGKTNTSPKRKMGHLTVTADTLEDAQKNARLSKSKIKITN